MLYSKRALYIQYGLAFFSAILLNILFGIHNLHIVLQGDISGPDGWMRLLRIHQGLQHGILVNYVVRDDEGHVLAIEWSRLYDFCIVGLALPLMVFVKQAVAIKLSGLLLTPLLSGFLAVVVMFIGKHFCRHDIIWLSGVIVGTTLAFIKQNGFGTVQYHLFIVFTLALAISAGVALFFNNKTRQTFLATVGGCLGAIAIWSMVENWPFVFAIYACLVWYEVWSKRRIASLAWVVSFFLSMVAFTLIDPPFGGVFVISYDHISVVFVCLAMFLLLGRIGVGLLNSEFKISRTGAMIACPIIAWLFFFPTIILGPWGLAHDADAKIFFAHTMQTMPIHGILNILAYGLPGIWTFLLLIYIALRYRPEIAKMGVLLICAFSTLFATGLAVRFAILTPFAGLFGAISALYLIDKSIDAKGLFKGFLIRLSTLLLVTCGSILLLVISVKMQPPSESSVVSNCAITKAVVDAFDSDFKTGTVLAPINFVPELLYKTQMTAVGSLYQHGIPYFIKAYKDWYFKSPNLQNIKYVAFCNDGSFQSAQDGSIGRILLENKVPAHFFRLDIVGAWYLFKIET